MPAFPRVGDGYLQERAPSAADRSTVLALDEERTVPAGTFADLLLVEDTSTLDTPDELVVRRAYAEGTGLVEETTMSGGTERARPRVGHDAPRWLRRDEVPSRVRPLVRRTSSVRTG